MNILPGPEMPKPSLGGDQPIFSRHDHKEKSLRITRDLSSLQREIRDDFDQRINELSIIMQKFKSLMVTDVRKLNAANDDNIPLLTTKVEEKSPVDDSTLADNNMLVEVENKQDKQDKQPVLANPLIDPLASYRETARFEAGLYQLNCQLYRFRLELDQELEFRREPLHIHFNDDSDLAAVLKDLTEKDSQEKNS